MFHALADSTRRDILLRCLHGSPSVSELADSYPMSFAAVQKHVAVLETAGLVSKKKNGRKRVVRTEVESLRKAKELLDRYEVIWRERIGRMDEVLAEKEEE